MVKKDIHEQVTNAILALLEQGTLPWRQSWKTNGLSVPANAISGRAYNGVNRIILWAATLTAGYPTHGWATYRQIQQSGGQVRKGEKGTRVVFYRQLVVGDDQQAGEIVQEDADENGEKTVRLSRVFTVFNLAQCEGLPAPQEPEPASFDPIPAARQFLANVNATMQHGGDRACYSPTRDEIQLPPFAAFTNAEAYYVTSLHEHVHWTGHVSRLNRLEKWASYGSETYACEELVAELGAAFLCAELSIHGDLEHHASYLQHWLTVLKQDKKALFRAAADASRAVDFLNACQPNTQERVA